MLGDRNARYGLVVDRFLGERELVVQPLDARLGKVKDISAAALMEDGAPVLIVDVDDMLRSIEKLLSEGLLPQVQRNGLESDRPQAETRPGGGRLPHRARVGPQAPGQPRLSGRRGRGWHGWLERGAHRPLRPGDYRRGYAAPGRHRAGRVDQEGPAIEIRARHDRFLQGPRGRPAARPGSGRGLLHHQGQLSR